MMNACVRVSGVEKVSDGCRRAVFEVEECTSGDVIGERGRQSGNVNITCH